MLLKAIDLVDNKTCPRREGIRQFEGPPEAEGLKIVDMDMVVLLQQQEDEHTSKRSSLMDSPRNSYSNDDTNIADDASMETVDSMLVHKRRRHLAGKRAAKRRAIC
jgi:hypothetical protein